MLPLLFTAAFAAWALIDSPTLLVTS